MKLSKLLGIGAIVAMFAPFSALPQTVHQFDTSPWNGYAPARVQCGSLFAANMNSTSDQAIAITVPGPWMVDSIVISDPSISLTTAAGGFYSAASKGGVAVVASGQAYSALTTNSANTTGNALLATISTAGNTTAFGGYGSANQISTLYLSLTTGQGSAATANIRVYCRPLYGSAANPY